MHTQDHMTRAAANWNGPRGTTRPLSPGHQVDASSLRPRDRELALHFGREIAPGAVVLTRATARTEIAKLRRVIAGLERLARDDRSIQIDAIPD